VAFCIGRSNEGVFFLLQLLPGLAKVLIGYLCKESVKTSKKVVNIKMGLERGELVVLCKLLEN
jgi:hypothetical protein